MSQIQLRLEEHADFMGDPSRALSETFVAVDESLKYDTSIDSELSGTTAVVMLLRQEGSVTTLYTANAGDSRAVLAVRAAAADGGKPTAADLSEDQKPDTPDEMRRIKGKGGFISPPEEEWGGPARVWLDASQTLPGLAMARSIGDHMVSSIGVIARPEVCVRELTDDDLFVVLASDGVWEFIDSQERLDPWP